MPLGLLPWQITPAMKLVASFLLTIIISINMLAQDNLYDIPLTDINGRETTLREHAGKVLLIVNVASKCGYTSQYEELQALYGEYAAQGLVVLGFPANNFMGQEPGSNEEIREFCTSKYQVTFPMYGKISVKGRDIHPLYAFLTATTESNVQWNFQKYVVDRDGNVTGWFKPGQSPMSEEVVAAIKELLSAN